ncbi:MAG: bifunctional precorrin-2 dehydrogenase/sirohydrochlorin ferrochelatase [Bacteroidota bacterium]
MKAINQNQLFPVFLKLDKVKLLIVGAGNVGYEKLFFLLKSSPNANVRVLAEVVSPEVRQLAHGKPNVEVIKKTFRPSDIKGFDIIIAATNNRSVNVWIRQVAKSSGLIVNVADTPDLCDFYLGSIVTKGDLKIAISTNGKSPTFAKRLRQLLEEVLPDNIPQILQNLRIIRSRLKGDFGNKVDTLERLTADLVAHPDQKI